MKNGKEVILKSVITFIAITGIFVWICQSEVMGQYPNSCYTCTENYSTCRLNAPQCVEDKINECRNGNDESYCENQRPNFEEACLNACYTTYNSCWSQCSTNLPTPPKEYTSAECPVISAQMGEIFEGVASGNVSKAQAVIIGGYAVRIYIDGNWVDTSIANDETAYAHSKSFSWTIPTLFRDGQEHILSAYVDDTCYGKQFLVPFDWMPTFVLSP